MQNIITEHVNVRGARQLIDIVYRQLCDEYNLPTEDGRKQMRYMVSNWITTHMAEERGGLDVEEDVRGIVTLADTDVIDTIDEQFRIPKRAEPSEACAPAPDGSFSPMDLVRADPKTLENATQFLNVYTQSLIAKKQIIEAEIQLLRLKRKNAPALTDGADHDGKKQRTDTPLVLDADQPQWLGPRYSISHHILHALSRGREPDVMPPLERVFKVVHDWFVDREGRTGKCQLRVKTVPIGNVPVVYGLPDGRHRFRGTKHQDQLVQYVRGVLFPPAPNATPSSTESTHTTDKDKVVAPIFQWHILPAELGPISVAQQNADIARLCAVCDIARDAWPTIPAEVGASPASLIRGWPSIPRTQPLGIGDWVKRLRDGGSPMPRGWLYTLAVFVRYLDGWNEHIATLPGRPGYLKAAVPFMRRVLLATRGIGADHPIAARLQWVANHRG
jgi:hypothetical protein